LSYLRRLIREVHQRSLWQVLGIYLAAGWVAYQVVLSLRDGIGLPGWVPGLSVVLLVIGLPVVLATAFVQEGGPSLRATPHARGDGASGATSTDATSSPPGAPPAAAMPASELPQGSGTQPAPPPAPVAVGAASTTTGPAGIRGLLTWRRAILGGVFAFVMLGVGTAGYMAMRVLGIGPVGTLMAKGVLKARDPILLADFQSPTRDTALSDIVEQALRIGLAQSQAVSLVEQSRVQQTLRRMRLPVATKMTPELARQVALREGFKAYLRGDVATAGGSTLITARLIAADSDQVLEAFQETAADSTKLLAAVDRLAASIRERMGESLKSIQAQQPLSAVTTSSLDALREFTMANRALNQGDDTKGIGLLDDAIRIDSTFAMAYRRLAAALDSRGEEPERALDAARAAVRFGDHLSDRERWQAVGYLAYETGRWEDARTAYESLLDVYPDDPIALTDLGLVYDWLGDLQKAEALFRRSIATADVFGGSYVDLIGTQISEGKLPDAQQALDAFRRAFPGSPDASEAETYIRVARGDLAGAAQVALPLSADGMSLSTRAEAGTALGLIAATRGRPAEAARWFGEAAAVDEQRGRAPETLAAQLNVALLDAWVRQDTTAAARQIDAALRANPLEPMPAGDRPYLQLAFADVAAGRVADAESVLREYRTAVDPDLRRPQEGQELGVQGLIELRRGRPDAALASFTNADRAWACRGCWGAFAGRADELLGNPDSAIADYERYIEDHDGFLLPGRYYLPGVPNHAWALAAVHERLGELYEQKGDNARAAQHYAAFTALWKDAEPELQSRIAAVRKRLQALAGKG
jgi:eukaryotic-like serine/threonine-protein kinase